MSEPSVLTVPHEELADELRHESYFLLAVI